MNIAIVDDQATDLEAAEAHLRQYIRVNHASFVSETKIETYSCAEDLLNFFLPGKYDLLILDIYMGSMNGMDAAQAIRERDTEVNIVFLTSSKDFLLDGYRVFASGYFIKPLADHGAEFARTFEHLFAKVLNRRRELVVYDNGIEITVPYRSICYVDINNLHQLAIHLPDQIISTTTPYSECQNQLTAEVRFLECYHRIIVNMDFVKSMTRDSWSI